MKKLVFTVLFCLCLFGRHSAIANPDLDREGCLICHQYPGLVRLEAATESFTILHIDESRYLKSSHGKLDCGQCHLTIHQVPHTGQSEVNCNSRCHNKNVDKQRIENFQLDRMHENQQSAITRLNDGSSCRVCHPLYPHSANVMVRAFLNMHTGFMTCEVCHLKKETFAECVYDWMDSEGADFSGTPYGTYYNPQLQQAHKSSHFLSRIAVYEVRNGKKKLLLNTRDTEAARTYLAQKAVSTQEREKALRFFHRGTNRKEVSVACEECHSKEGILDLKGLGFSSTKANNLVRLNIKGLVTRYKKFYFPEFLQE
jgi:hypothetical protein